MSDYLGNLALRTLSPTVGVRPQLLSVFEAPRANSELRVPLDFSSDTSTEASPVAPPHTKSLAPSRTLPPVDREPAHEPSLSAARHSAPKETSPARDEPDAVQPPHIFPQAVPTPRVADEPLAARADWRVGAVQPRPPRRANGVGTTEPTPDAPGGLLPLGPSMPRQPQLTARVADVPSAARDERQIESVQPRRPRVADGVGTAELAGEGISPLPVQSSTSLEPTTAAAPLRPPISTARTAVHPSVIVKPAATPDQAQREGILSPAVRPLTPFARISPPQVPPVVAAVPPPTIHVTIGRVEVRATPPAGARQRPPAAAAPRLTLEEYLRRRASGGPQ